ncbi:MAG: esterase [Tannerellaceae bacterium]|jgi:enterochelin esterase family protein|nr:esterase [Tannerellaceae bacterium]
MRKWMGILSVTAALFAADMQAQQNLFGGQDILSAVVNADRTVTFRCMAPDAQKVQVAGDFAATVEDNPVGGIVGTGLLSMTKDEKGVWIYTSGPLEPELYSYLFVVDGVATLDINNPHVYRDFATISNVFLVGGGQADLYQVNDIPHGSLTHRWYDSPALGTDRRINIYTPPGYERSGERYPVLYLLHGAGGDEDEWVTFGKATRILDNLINQGKAKPMILVMPNGHIHLEAAPGESSRGFYKPEHLRLENAAGAFEANFKEIIDFTDRDFRTIPDKAHRAIAGLSMGGGHAMTISGYFENTFDYVGLFSAAAGGRSGRPATGVYAGFDTTLKKQFDNGVKLYWIGIGTEDFLYNANKQLRAQLDAIGAKYTYVETGGGHVWKNWRIYLSDFAPLLFR